MTGREMCVGVVVVVYCHLLLPSPGQTASPYQAVQQGNVLYHAGQYEEAAKAYAAASRAHPEAAEIHFNQGNVFYKQQNYTKALQHYTQALHTATPDLASRITYNLGNVAYRRALADLQHRENALQHVRAAITYYRDSLRIDAQQHDTRYNLELAYRLQHQLLRPRQPRLQPRSGQLHRQQQQPAPKTAPSQGQQTSRGTASATPDRDEVGTEKMTLPKALSPDEAQRQLEAIRSRAQEAAKLRRQWQRARLRDARRTNKYW